MSLSQYATVKPKPCVDFEFVGLISFDFAKIKERTVMSCLLSLEYNV